MRYYLRTLDRLHHSKIDRLMLSVGLFLKDRKPVIFEVLMVANISMLFF
jgi:hypothetical protein